MNTSLRYHIETGEPMTVFYYMSLIFGIILTPILTLLGVLGNLIAIIVLINLLKRNRHKIFSLYIILISLAVSDSLILLLNFLVNFVANCYEYTGWVWFFLPYQYQGYLIVSIWPLIMSFQMSSIYLTLLISYDRWRAICRPLKRTRSMYSSKFLLKIIFLVFIFCIVYNIPRWFEFQLEKSNLTLPQALSFVQHYSHRCNLNGTSNMSRGRFFSVNTEFLPALLSEKCGASMHNYNKTLLANNAIFKYVYIGAMYLIIVFLFPLVFITMCNIQLVLAIKTNRKQWSKISRLQQKEMHQTKVPFIIVLLFYILGIPHSVINIIDSTSEHLFLFSKDTEVWNSLVAICNLGVLLNSSSNFIIYCLLGKKFRLALVRCLVCGDNTFSRWLLHRRIISNKNFLNRSYENSSIISHSYCKHNSQKKVNMIKIDRIVELEDFEQKLNVDLT